MAPHDTPRCIILTQQQICHPRPKAHCWSIWSLGKGVSVCLLGLPPLVRCISALVTCLAVISTNIRQPINTQVCTKFHASATLLLTGLTAPRRQPSCRSATAHHLQRRRRRRHHHRPSRPRRRRRHHYHHTDSATVNSSNIVWQARRS